MKLYTVIIAVWLTKYHINPAKYKLEVRAINEVCLHNEINSYLVKNFAVYGWELREIVNERSISAGVISLVFIPE